MSGSFDKVSSIPNSDSGARQSLPGNSIQQHTLAPGLYLVATPIGNLRDMTLRGLDVLASADHILCEDTRHSRTLLSHYGIKTPVSAYHDHNEAKRVAPVITKLREGASYALISDAGTPLLSDPGYKLVHAALNTGVDVFVLPGANAAIAALQVSGLPCDRFLFAGFLPTRRRTRKKVLKNLETVPASLIFYESVRRVPDVLADMVDIYGDREAGIARELTKRYEQVLRGSLSELLTQISTSPLRGEIVLVIGPPGNAPDWDPETLDAALRAHIPEMGVKRAVKTVAELSGQKKREIYVRALELKHENRSTQEG